MRLVLPIVLLLAVLGTAFLLLRGDPAGTPAGAGPGASPVAGDATRAPLDLARGERTGTTRAAAVTPERPADGTSAAAPDAGAAQLAASLPPPVPEPSMEGGSTDGPVGTAAVNDVDEALAQKYRDWSRAERVQALETLRATLEIQRSSTDKDQQASLPALKHEMGWLESNLDG